VPVRRAVVVGPDRPAEDGCGTEQAEVVAGHQLPVHRRLRRPVNADVQSNQARRRHSGEHRLIAGEGAEGGVRILVADLPQPLRMLDGQGPPRHRIQQAEDGRIRADAQRQGEHDGDTEQRCAAQEA
jgi:hypothetical protein